MERTKTIGALWRTLDPQEKAIWSERARANASISDNRVVSKMTSPNAMSFFTKETMAEAPPGHPRERLRYVGTRWRALSDEEKATWAQKAAEQKVQSQGSTNGMRGMYMQPHLKLPNAVRLFYTEKMAERPVGRLKMRSSEWNALSSEEKEAWIRKAAVLQQAILQKSHRPPKFRSGYHVFISNRLVALDGNMSLVAAEWKAASSDLREQCFRRAAELNVSAMAQSKRRSRKIPSSPGFISTMGLYFKETMTEAPKGTPQERMRYAGAQWRSLSSEEKAAWTRKAAELRVAMQQEMSVT